MIDYCTYIDIQKSHFDISYNDRLMFIGSCFADNIGCRMSEQRFNIDVNPFGVLYNPLSIASGCRLLQKPELFVEDDIFCYNGMYHSFMHHGKFSDISAANCIEKINGSLNIAANHFKEISYLVITFGTSYIYRLNDREQFFAGSGKLSNAKEIDDIYNKTKVQVVANCHKLPAVMFERELLTVDEIVNEWSGLLEDIWSDNPSLKVIFTVSPIRHMKDGAHMNQISKATLLLAEQSLYEKYPERISYFPAYELMMDELRDYRFYADDMLHPSKVAVDYIWERFCDMYLDKATKDVLKEVEQINLALNHKPLNPSSDVHKQFLIQTLLKIKRLQAKYPYLCFSEYEKEMANIT